MLKILRRLGVLSTSAVAEKDFMPLPGYPGYAGNDLNGPKS